jgi:hypothetical protein
MNRNDGGIKLSKNVVAVSLHVSHLVNYISLRSTNVSKDAGRKIFLEDTFECEERNIPGGTWGPAKIPWQEIVSMLLQHNLMWARSKTCMKQTGWGRYQRKLKPV